MKFFVFIICLLLAGGVKAQIDSVARCLEKIKAATDDSSRVAYADGIADMLRKTTFGSYNVAAPVKFMGYKRCSNAEAELFAWSVPLEKGVTYYNLIRFKDKKTDYYLRSLPGEENSYPPYLFYDLLSFENNKKEYFVLLGWAQTPNTNQKIACIARFETNGKINFKSKLLRRGKSRSASISFEYAREGSMMLKHDKKGKRIIFDHLTPMDKKYEGYFMFYGSDGSYDVLNLKKGEWWFQENVKK